jgi:hypothetical protein
MECSDMKAKTETKEKDKDWGNGEVYVAMVAVVWTIKRIEEGRRGNEDKDKVKDKVLPFPIPMLWI